jgi:hypothetical protein
MWNSESGVAVGSVAHGAWQPTHRGAMLETSEHPRAESSGTVMAIQEVFGQWFVLARQYAGWGGLFVLLTIILVLFLQSLREQR